MSQQKKLFLLDAYALIFRGYYAFIKNPRINSKGMDTSAILGFMNSLMDVIKRERPDHLAVAFDKGGSHVRTEMFTDYKANRSETPEAIRIAIPYIQDILKAMHIPIVELEGCEADDLIGTIAKQAEKQNYQVYMVTPDKDFAQLVSENIFMYKPARMGNGIEILGVPEVLEKFGIERPDQVIDFLGMMGDAVDNIPGIPGVGEVTAKKFLKQFGTIENLLANSHQLKGKMKQNIEENHEKALMSKTLATIICDCDVTFNETDYELTRPDSEKVEALFQELEFRRMAEQFNNLFYSGDEPSAKATKPSANNAVPDLFSTFTSESGEEISMQQFNILSNTTHFYQLIQGEMGIKLLLQNLLKQTSVSIDTETTSTDFLEAKLVGLAFSWEKGQGFFLPLPENADEAKATLEKFKPFFESETIEKIGHNLKYDLKVLSRYGITVSGKLFDTMLAHYLINPDMRHSMDVLSETYLHYTPKTQSELIGKGKTLISLRLVPLEDLKEFAVEDADITGQLKTVFEKSLEENEATKLFETIEIPLLVVLADMETEGIRLDVDFLKTLSFELDKDIQNLEAKIHETAGETFNIGSPKQLGEILFDKLQIGGAKQKKTKTGQYATGEEVLSLLADENPIVAEILEYRQLIKLKNTYVDALPLQVCASTGRIHTEYMQAVAATGRLSSNNPNLQNIPIRTERGRQIRKAFVPRDENYTIVSADYSQIELRIIAALSGEKNMIEAFNANEDIHKSTAAKVFNVAVEDVTREQRSHAKTVNFGIIYGVSAFGLSNQTSLSRAESKDLIDAYYASYPQLKNYIQEQIDLARERGYAETISGRRRYLKDINSQNAMVRSAAERNAVNAPIQGSAADIIKIAMINIHKRLTDENWKSKMLLQVHDELVFDVHNSELEKIQPLIKHEMENAFKLDVPLTVELGMGKDWLEAH
ncbi:DNA polymerase I [Flavobacterium ardleyense]|uniref:DNA polymerase I n=1 Tax=Flavobacterium ardleyense TaxID=2038737 RepID=UPI00298C645C|nr:DNA polymerase I [Flavobacterium ardleyense]